MESKIKKILKELYYLIEDNNDHRKEVGQSCNCVRCISYREVKNRIDQLT